MDTVIQLPDKFITKDSLYIVLDSEIVESSHFKTDYRFGKIFFDITWLNNALIASQKSFITIDIFYKFLPFNIPDSYSRFEVVTKLDTLKRDSVQVAEIKSDVFDNIFSGTELEKSGSIFRGVTLGNNRDLTLNSGFRLQMNGKLSKDIEITAALTDESTPIQPEGNTQKLQELDKVFIELKSKNIVTTLGDIDVNFSNLNLFNFSKKVQGVKGFGNFGKSDLFISGSISRGRFSTNLFNGIDGVQGPYRLVGADNEVNIVVIAGTEKVYLDGVLMTRGENNDYTIDYSNGQLSFTNRRLITNASRITVDFEYSDKKYSRSLIVSQGNTLIFNDRLKLSFSYIRQNDDKDKPIDFALSDSDRIILSNAGDDKFKASKSGVSYAGRDTNGIPLGVYVQVDTLIGGSGYTIYRYQPGDTNALYNVTFSYVGSGKGDYISLSSTTYQFTGINQGSYAPLVFLPLPVMYQAGDIFLNLKLTDDFSFNLETAVSNFDKNLFSSSDDKNNTGLALISSLVFSKRNFKIGKTDLGDVKFSISQKYINKLYNSIDRMNAVEYNRIWDIQDSTSQTEITTEFEMDYKPLSFLTANLSGGRIKRGDAFSSLRGFVDLQFTGDSIGIPSARYAADYIFSSDTAIDYRGRWIRQAGVLGFALKLFGAKDLSTKLNLFFRINNEDKQMKSYIADTLTPGSFRFYEFKPGLRITNFFKMDFLCELNFRLDDVFNQGSLTRQSKSLSQNYSIRSRDINFMTAQFDVTVYDRKFTDVFKSQGFNDNRTVLVTSHWNLWFFNRGMQASLFYKISSERTAKREVVFIKVQLGQGNYKYIGDINGNGIQDENEFILVNYDGDYIKLFLQTDQSYPTTDLQSSATFSFNPSQIFGSGKSEIFNLIINNISLSTYLTVNEKSKDPVQKNIYLLRFSKFQNDENTITGTNSIQQDINLFEFNKYFGVKFRFVQRKGFNQYYSGNERAIRIERSARLRLSFTEDLTLLSDVITDLDRNNAPGLSVRNRNIKGTSFVEDLVYKPYRDLETGFKLEIRRANDYYPVYSTQADINDQSLRLIYTIAARGRLRIEIERSEIILNTNPLFVPYELTNGKVPGKSYFWTLSFDYRISNFIQATVNYFGRAEGNSKVIHTGTAEIRAYF